MIKTLNKQILIAYAKEDVVLNFCKNDTPYVSFEAITETLYRNRSNQLCNSIEFHRLKAYNDLAQKMANEIQEGYLIYVEGLTETFSKDLYNGESKLFKEVRVKFFSVLNQNLDEYQCVISN